MRSLKNSLTGTSKNPTAKPKFFQNMKKSLLGTSKNPNANWTYLLRNLKNLKRCKSFGVMKLIVGGFLIPNIASKDTRGDFTRLSGTLFVRSVGRVLPFKVFKNWKNIGKTSENWEICVLKSKKIFENHPEIWWI